MRFSDESYIVDICIKEPNHVTLCHSQVPQGPAHSWTPTATLPVMDLSRPLWYDETSRNMGRWFRVYVILFNSPCNKSVYLGAIFHSICTLGRGFARRVSATNCFHSDKVVHKTNVYIMWTFKPHNILTLKWANNKAVHRSCALATQDDPFSLWLLWPIGVPTHKWCKYLPWDFFSIRKSVIVGGGNQ